MVEYHPISAKDLSRLHQIGTKVLLVTFLGCAFLRGESGKEIFWSQTMRRWKNWTRPKCVLGDSLQRNWFIKPKNCEFFIFPIADGAVKLSGRDQVFPKIHLDTGSSPTGRRAQRWSLRTIGRVSTIRQKPETIFGRSKGFTFTFIPLNLELNSSCLKKNHFLFRWSTPTLPERLTHPWMQCWRKRSAIIGTWMEIENCQMHGQVSHDSLH